MNEQKEETITTQQPTSEADQQPETGTPPHQLTNIAPVQQSADVAFSPQPTNIASAQQSESILPSNQHDQQSMSNDETQESPEEQENKLENEEDDEQIKINCPEKIVLCFDLSSELSDIIVRQNQVDTRTVFEKLMKSMEIFIKHKLQFNRKHQIAILTFEKEALWVQDFSNDLSLINDTLHNIRTNPTDPLPQFDMTSLLETIEKHVELPTLSNTPDIPPEYVVRVILFYGRSHSELPSLPHEAKRIFDQFVSCPLFFFDVLYIHEIPDESNQCELLQGFDVLSILPTDFGKSPVFQLLPDFLPVNSCQNIVIVVCPLTSIIEDQISDRVPADILPMIKEDSSLYNADCLFKREDSESEQTSV